MFTRILMTAVVLSLALGCAKKTAKNTGRADDTPLPPVEVEKPKVGVADKEKKDEKPTWLRPRPHDGVLPVDAPGTGKQPWVANPPPVPGAVPPLPPGNPGGQPMAAVVPPPMGTPLPVNPQPVVPPPAPATGTPAGPAGKAVAKADMNEVWIFMENASIVNGKLPRPELVYAALVKAESPAADLVKGGYILLTGKSGRESVWAFERNAPSQGGWIASQNGPEQVTAAEFARRIRE